MIDLSLVYLSYRPGGYDILADSLINQTYQNYELIIVDDYTPNRSQEVKAYLENRNIKVKYIGPSKPKCFPELAYNVANAINTGIILSTKEVVIVITDYQWFAPDCLEKVAKRDDLLKNRTCIVLPARTWESSSSRDNSGIITVWEKEWKGYPLENNCVERAPWVPTGWEFAFTAYPWNVLTDLNGFPECLDSYAAHPLLPLLEWLNTGKAKPFVDTGNFMHAINHREWQPAELWHQAKRTPKGSTQFVKRDNVFNLKTMPRGEAYWLNEDKGEKRSMTVTLPFKAGGQILEVGGGDQPLFRPNLDMRKLPTVDYVCDLEGKWPIADESFDGVFGKFVIEHIAWRKIPYFLSECFRVLKPDGAIMMVSPNTLEQCREIVKLGKISIESNSLIFGGQEERGWNEHKAAFSPEYAAEIFQKAGFINVQVEPWPGQIWTGAQTDMIIRAYKHPNIPYKKGDRHQWIRDHVKASESIIDLGCGPTQVWEGWGYNVKTVDERNDFHPDIVCKADSVPLPNKSFDTVILGDILEHYDIPSRLLTEAMRLAKKKIVITVPWEENWSKNLNPFTHHDHKVNYTQTVLTDELKKYECNFTTEEVNVDIDYRDSREKEHWSWVGAVMNLEEKMNQEFTDQKWYQELEKTMSKPNTTSNDPKIKLNIGSFTVMAKDGWTNCDILDLNQYANQNGFLFKQFDATKGIPYPDNSVDLMISSHFMEHITRQEGSQFLNECYRAMKPGGIIRLTVPDTVYVAKVYSTMSGFKICFSGNEGVKNAEDECEAYWNFITAGHKTAYDLDSLFKKMLKAGFEVVMKMEAGKSRSPEIQSETKDMFEDHSLYMEGMKPLVDDVKPPAINPGVPDGGTEPYQKYLKGLIEEGKQ